MQPFGVVLLAGGSGERFGEPKAFVEFGGKELWEYPFDVSFGIQECKEIIVVIPDDSLKSDVGSIAHFIPGGNGRARDCLAALEHIESRRVVVLEAARPLVTREQVLALAGGLYPSVIYGVEVTDTVYNSDNVWCEYQKENCFGLLGTGGYNTSMLKEAYQNIFSCYPRWECPCDSWAMKNGVGIKPVVWSVGPVNNLFKVTYPHDLEILGVIQRKMKKF